MHQISYLLSVKLPEQMIFTIITLLYKTDPLLVMEKPKVVVFFWFLLLIDALALYYNKL